MVDQQAVFSENASELPGNPVINDLTVESQQMEGLTLKVEAGNFRCCKCQIDEYY